jgi:hypothetical protein
MFGRDRFGASIASSFPALASPMFLVMPKVRSDITNTAVEIVGRNAAATLLLSDASAIFAVFPHDVDAARQGESLG